MQLVDRPEGEVQLPGTQTVALPKYPRGNAPPTDEPGTRRMHLGIWMVSRENPFLSRTAVNRAWAHMFGRGLIEPVDDLNERNPASHPQLFDELTSYFVETGFDMRNMLRTLANTRAYQLTSRVASDGTSGRTSFARMSVKALTAEQLYDSLRRAALSGVADWAPAGRVVAGGLDPAAASFRRQDAIPFGLAARFRRGGRTGLATAQWGGSRNGNDKLGQRAVGGARGTDLFGRRAGRDSLPGHAIAPAARARAGDVARAGRGRQVRQQ